MNPIHERRYDEAIGLLGSGRTAVGLGILEDLAAQGVPEAEHSLAYCHEAGLGTKRDVIQAIYWYTAAATHGNPPSQVNLGTLYLEGATGHVDYGKAVVWFRAAAKQQFPLGLYNLARMYQEGLGVEKDRDSAYKLYVAAANGGHVQAANNIGCMLLKNTDLPDHLELARQWFRWGAERGDTTAGRNLAIAR